LTEVGLIGVFIDTIAALIKIGIIGTAGIGEVMAYRPYHPERDISALRASAPRLR